MSEPRYQYRASWSDEDGGWIGVCNGFQMVSHIAANEADCLSGIRGLVDDILADLHSNGETLPQPLPWDDFDSPLVDTAAGFTN